MSRMLSAIRWALVAALMVALAFDCLALAVNYDDDGDVIMADADAVPDLNVSSEDKGLDLNL